MEINWFGLSFLIVYILLVLLFKKIRFVDLFVFSIPFNSTTVITVFGTPVNLPLMLFFFTFFTLAIKIFLDSKLKFPKNLKINFQWLLLIGIAALVSEIMPFIINGDYKVLDRYNSLVFYAKEVPLKPNIQWITQCIYFIIGILVVYIIVLSYDTRLGLKRFFIYYFAGIIFMLFWGWFEFLCFFANIEYPYYIFDHIGMSRNGILVTNGFPRMISVTLEASYLAQILIPIIPFFYWFGQSKSKFIYSTWFYKILYFISIITLLVAQTSTGILGFLLVMGLLLKNKISSYKKSIRLVFIFIFIIICIVGLFFAVNLIIKKSNNYSGIERLKTVILGFEYFLHYPILGLGWGVFPTYDFIVNLLANFGLVGTIPFFIFLRNIYMSFKQKIKIEESKMYKAGFESFILILIVSQLSGFIYHSQYFWIYIGVAFCISSMHNKKLVS